MYPKYFWTRLAPGHATNNCNFLPKNLSNFVDFGFILFKLISCIWISKLYSPTSIRCCTTSLDDFGSASKYPYINFIRSEFPVFSSSFFPYQCVCCSKNLVLHAHWTKDCFCGVEKVKMKILNNRMFNFFQIFVIAFKKQNANSLQKEGSMPFFARVL